MDRNGKKPKAQRSADAQNGERSDTKAKAKADAFGRSDADARAQAAKGMGPEQGAPAHHARKGHRG